MYTRRMRRGGTGVDEEAPGRFRMRRFGARLPLVYGLAARAQDAG